MNNELHNGLLRVASGQACLFLGAGFATLFKDIKSRNLPTGAMLAKEMIAECQGKTTTDLRVAATQFLKAAGNETYAEFIRERFTTKDIDPIAIDIAQEPWARVYTTNFDDGYENAAAKAGRKVLSTTIADDTSQFLHSSRVCVHVHGFVDRLSPSAIEKDVVLTLPGYASHQFLESPWHSLLKHDLRAARAVFFIGYSLYDLDIVRTLEQCGSDLKSKTFFITSDEPNSDLEILLGDFGTFCPIGVSGFAAALSKLDRSSPLNESEYFRAFSELLTPRNPHHPKDADMYRLLMSGVADEDLLLTPKEKDTPVQYSVDRKIVTNILDCLSPEHPNFISIHGEFSNGKSIALFQAARSLLERGFRVFTLVDSSQNWPEEIQRIFRTSIDPVAFLIDDCTLRLNCAEDTARFLRKGDVILLADRSIRLDSIEDRIRSIAGKRQLYEFDVDELTNEERQGFISLLQVHGLWGEFADRSAMQKNSLVQNNFGNQVRGILLGALHSPDAIERLKLSLYDVDFKSPQFDPLVMCLVLAVTHASELRQDVIDDLVGSTPLRKLLASSEGARTIVKLRSPNLINAVSSIVAETIVRKFVPLETLVRCIKNAVRRSLQYSVSREDRQFPKSIMRFSAIQQLLPDTETRSLKGIEEIYDSIKTEPGFSTDPQFWLQYAICQLFLRSFERAETYFQTAYKVCHNGYDKRFIDNHYARYLLENVVEGPGSPFPIEIAEDQVNQAKRLLLPQFDENAHYPYKVAARILDFVTTYQNDISEPTRAGLLRFIEKVSSCAKRELSRGNHHRYIYQCENSLRKARALIEGAKGT